MGTRKILIMGFPNSGKTCIKKAFFDGEDPEKLITKSGAPEPTLGIQNYNYSWIDTDVGIIDSSGQEINKYLEDDDEEKEKTFGSTDVIIYVFDLNNWLNQKKEVIENLEKICKVAEAYASNAQIFAFCHKIDMIVGDKEKRSKTYADIRSLISIRSNVKTLFTSIAPHYVHTLLRSMQIMLNELSKKGTNLENFLKEILLKEKSSALMLLDKDLKVISERRSEDISVQTMFSLITALKLILKTFRNINPNDNLDDAIIKSKNNVRIFIKQLDANEFNLRYAILASISATRTTLDNVLEFINLSN